MLDLGADACLAVFHAFRTGFELTFGHRPDRAWTRCNLPTYGAILIFLTLAHTRLASVAIRKRFLAVQQLARLGDIGHVRRRGRDADWRSGVTSYSTKQTDATAEFGSTIKLRQDLRSPSPHHCNFWSLVAAHGRICAIVF